MITVKELKDKQFVKTYIEKNHYSHKIPQAVKYRLGLYLGDKLKGVAIFSIPANQYSITSVFRDETQKIVIELSRVYTEDNLEKNFLSKALSQCFKYLKNNADYDIILSYADPNFNHNGCIYQALNGMYLGQTNKEVRYIIGDKLITRRGLGRRKGLSEKEHVKMLLEAGAKKVKMIGKYKYIWFICNKTRKKELIKKMKVTIKQYPKIK